MALFPESFNARLIKPFIYRVRKTPETRPNFVEYHGDYALIHLCNMQKQLVGKAIIDVEDVEKVTKQRWCLNDKGYAFNFHLGAIHNLIMGVKARCDHINLNKLDNRKINLRLCTNQENAFNRDASANNKLGVKGVHWEEERGKYAAKISFNYKTKFLGRFVSLIDAAEAYNKAALELFGEFAKLNDIEALKLKHQAAQPT